MKLAPASPNSLFWFRKGLRLHDNPSLWAAIRDAKCLYAVFVLDPWFLKPERVGVNRLNFLLQSLTGANPMTSVTSIELPPIRQLKHSTQLSLIDSSITQFTAQIYEAVLRPEAPIFWC